MPAYDPLPERLTGPVLLRELREDDWALEQALSRDPEVVRWTLYPADLTEERARARITRSLARTASGELRRYVVVDGSDGDDGAALGTCAVVGLACDAPEIVYALTPAARGRGAATEAARMLASAVVEAGYRRAEIVTVEGNAASERVAERAGFVRADEHEGDHRGRPAVLTRWTRRAARVAT